MTRAILAALVLALALTGCVSASLRVETATPPPTRGGGQPVTITASSCGTTLFGATRTGVARGTVTNRTSVTVDVFIEISWEDSDRVIVDQSNDWVRNLPPGRTAEWEARTFDDQSRACTAIVSSVHES